VDLSGYKNHDKPDANKFKYDTTNVSVLLGNGNGTFQPHVDYAAGFGSYSLVVNDINNDGKPDLIVANSNDGGGSVSILYGNGDGTFQAANTFHTGPHPDAVVVADFNGDGKLDLAAGSAFGAALLQGNGDGTFQTSVFYQAGANSYVLGMGDLNNDGALDLMMVNSGSGTVSALLNMGGSKVKATSSPNPSHLGQSVTFVVSVAASLLGQPVPTGTVTLKDGSTTLATLTLTQGRAHFSTSTLSVGSHTITTSYSGDSNFNPNTAPPITQKVNP
jgi:hypothetical protein